MKNTTPQMKRWASELGSEYTKRNPMTMEDMDDLYENNTGVKRSTMNERFLTGLAINNTLEVGCNVGVQLMLLHEMGYRNLYGVELQDIAIDISKEITQEKNIYIIKGSAFDIPYKDSFFDMVFTSGLLIHISPDDIDKVLDEVYRCSGRYIWGYEYYSEGYEKIDYRKENGLMWKTDFGGLFLKKFKDLKLIKEEKYPYTDNPENVDRMYLLEKTG